MAMFSPAANEFDGTAGMLHQEEVDNDIEAEGEAIDAEALLFDCEQDGTGTGTGTSTAHLMAHLKEATKGVVGEKTLKGYDQ
jgi:hypothetical protein